MGKSWKDDDWHDIDEMWEEEQRKRKKRSKRVVNENDDESPAEYERR